MSARTLAVVGAAVLAVALGTGEVLAQKYGGILRTMQRNNPPSMSPHEESSIETTYPSGPLFSNLATYPSDASIEKLEALVPELAESWRWANGNRELVFTLRQGVTFHDGKPFTSKDVKFTYDTFRWIPGAYRPKLNPRKLWWSNVREITTTGDHEVTFHLKQPQPSLLALLATGYAPVYPAHKEPRSIRTDPVGTGPFKLQRWDRDKNMEYVKNPAYFIRNRPYLDGITFAIIKSRATRISTLLSGAVDIPFPGEDIKPVYETLRQADRGLIFTPNVGSAVQGLIVNTQKPPFNDRRLQRVVNLALDRAEFTRGLRRGGNTTSGTILPPPFGVWGLSQAELAEIPGYGDPVKEKEEARRIMGELGYSAARPLVVKMATRQQESYVEVAVWAMAALKEVWIDSTLEQLETTQWYSKMTRRDYQIGTNSQGTGADDPDAVFFEHFGCGSARNITGFCDPAVQKRIEEQSQEFDFAKRLKLVKAIDRDLQLAAIRPMLGFRHVYHSRYPWVKGYTPRQNYYGISRYQDVWLDK